MQPESAIDRRIFVVGVPRSGTTLVQSLLAAHSTTTSFTESHFFDRHFTLVPILREPILTRDPTARVREFLAENEETPPEAARWFGSEGRSALGPRPLLPLRTRRAAQQLLRVLDELTLRRGKSRWIEKTPRHLRYIPFLESVSGVDSEPRTSFVHVVRDGLEVVASLHEASKGWERPYDLNACVRRWNRDVRFSLSRIATPSDHVVFYEKLTTEPEATLQHLFASLDLDWEPDILERYARTSARLITDEEGWKTGVGRTIRPSATSGWKLSQEQRDRVSQTLRRELYHELLETVGAP